jgi:peptidoglycan/xylan/chitin deacetylase (PgdA/CDA1 family)
VVATLLAVFAGAACDPPAIPVPGRTAGSLGAVPGQVALTFDDGPDPTWTPQVLDVLDRFGVHATFFVIGSQVQRHPELARAIVERGHAIAGHTWSHADLTTLSAQGARDQVESAAVIIQQVTGTRSSCTRPPYGATDAMVDATIATLGMRPALWTVDTRDWTRPGVASIVATASTVRPDGVILLHDGGGNRAQTVAALPEIIGRLEAAGFSLGRICDPRPGA